MAKQPEAKFKAKVQQVLKEARGLHPNFVIAPSDAIMRGFSDLLICWRGVLVALELKVDTDVTGLQQAFLHGVRLGEGLAGELRLVDAKADIVELRWMKASGRWFGTIRFGLERIPVLLDAEYNAFLSSRA